METKMSYDQFIPTRIMFGAGQLNNLHKQAMPGNKALIIISNGKSTRTNGYLARTEQEMSRRISSPHLSIFRKPAEWQISKCQTTALLRMNFKPLCATPAK